MFVLYSSSNFPTHFVNVWLILHFKILQNNFYINAFSINFLVNVNWGGEGPPNVNACQQGGRGGRKSRKSCQRSLRMPPNTNCKILRQYIGLFSTVSTAVFTLNTLLLKHLCGPCSFISKEDKFSRKLVHSVIKCNIF